MGRLSKELATILLDVPVTFDAKAYRLTDPDHMAVAKLFEELEFRRMQENFNKIFSTTTEVATTSDSLATEKPQRLRVVLTSSINPELVQHLKKLLRTRIFPTLVSNNRQSHRTSIIVGKIITSKECLFRYRNNGTRFLASGIGGYRFLLGEGKRVLLSTAK